MTEATNHPSDHPLALPVGTELVGDYIITKVLGAGGFGITYEASERSLDRLVAIKEFFPTDIVDRQGWALVQPRSKDLDMKYARGLRRFIEEAKAITQFNHPNIVRVLRYFKTNNTAFMVLQYEDGVDFGDWRDAMSNPPSEQRILSIIHPLLDALALIHESDFLHRDVAPDNIIIRKDGSPVLIDFGSARSELTFNSKTVSALVKTGYSPFEQYAKNSKEQGPWTDIYSFGATLYQIVTGGAPPDSLSRLAKDEMVPAVKKAKKYYSRAFLAAIDKALEVKIDDRPQSIDDWRTLLFPNDPARSTAINQHTATQDGSSNQSPQTHYHTPDQGWTLGMSRDKGHNVSPVAGLIKKASALQKSDIGESAKRLAAKIKEPLAKFTPKREEETDLEEELPAPTPNRRSLLSLIDELDHRKEILKEKEDSLLPRHVPDAKTGATNSSDPISPPGPPEPPAQSPHTKATLLIETFKQRFARMPFVHLLTKTRLSRPMLAILSVLIVGLIASISFRSQLSAIADRAGLPKAITSPSSLFGEDDPHLIKTVSAHNEGVSNLYLSRDGALLLSAGPGRDVKVWNARSGTLISKIPQQTDRVRAFDAYGDWVATADKTGRVTLTKINGEEKAEIYKLLDGPINAISFTGRRKELIVGGANGDVYLASLGKDTIIRQFRGTGHNDAILALAPYERYFITASADHTAKLWGLSKRNLIRTYRSHDGPITAIAISSRTRRFATGSDDQTVRLWSTRARRVRKILKGHEGIVRSVAFSSNGSKLASGSADKTIKLWNVAKGQLLKTFTGHSGAVQAILFQKYGNRLISGSKDGTIRFWSLETPAARN